MAALNTIRTKGGVVVAVLISLALLSFLLGDLTNSSGSMFGSSNQNVGSIMDTEVSIKEYSNTIDKITLAQQMLTGNESQTEEATSAIRSQAWDKIIRENIFGEDLKELGLLVSKEESVDMLNGEYISPVLRSIFVNNQTGGYDYSTVSGFIKNIDADPTGRAGQFWSYIEEEIVDEREMTKYFSLIEQGIYITENEVKQTVAASNNNYSFEFISKPVYTVADSLVSVTDSEIKKYYEANKKKFRSVETRDVEYVIYEALPSEEDYANAAKEVAEIAADFDKSTDLQQFVNLNSSTNFDPRFKKATELSAELSAYAFDTNKASIYGPALSGDIYTTAKVIETKLLPDTLGAKHILVAATDRVLADSLIKVLKRDRSKFSELASQFSMDQNANLSGGDLGLFNMEQMIPEFSAAIAASRKGDIISVDTQFGIHVVEVTEIGKKFPKVQLAVVDYVVNPSNKTSQITYSKATEFANAVNSKGIDFDTAVSEQGTSKRVAKLRAGDREIQGLDGTTEIVRWAFENEAGAISDVVAIGEQNIVARVASANEHGTLSLQNAAASIRMVLMNEKKSEYLTAQLSGLTTLAEMATKLEVEVATATGINFKRSEERRVGKEC